jgi:sec-independent protein translocase protein TatC
LVQTLAVKPFWEHFVELTERLKVIIKAIFIAFILFIAVPVKINSNANLLTNPLGSITTVTEWILQEILNLEKPKPLILIAGTLSAPLVIYFIAAFLFAVLATSPITAYEIYKYVDPALYPHERKAIYPFIFSFVGLFWGGVFFGLFYLTPLIFLTMVPFFGLVGASAYITVNEFYQVVLITTFASGVIFTFPTVFVLLVRVGILSTRSITKNRLYFYSALFVVTAIVTPDGGPVADLILFIPAIVLTETGLLFGKYYEKKRMKESGIPERLCRFCNKPIDRSEIFCHHCGRAQE